MSRLVRKRLLFVCEFCDKKIRKGLVYIYEVDGLDRPVDRSFQLMHRGCAVGYTKMYPDKKYCIKGMPIDRGELVTVD